MNLFSELDPSHRNNYNLTAHAVPFFVLLVMSDYWQQYSTSRNLRAPPGQGIQETNSMSDTNANESRETHALFGCRIIDRLFPKRVEVCLGNLLAAEKTRRW